ncbi:MAG: TPM domain-containing protein [Tannerella sp.]|jgi:uncharacterized protein|nr:TPM domain-containing protein [Tannerella sp.]
MKNILYIIIFQIFTLSLSLSAVSAQEIPDPPDPPRLVNDFASVLTPNDASSLEAELTDFDRRTSTQIAIVTVTSLNGYDIADYAFRLGEKWGIGRKNSNNGVLIVFKPKTDREQGRVFVAVGYGLEGVIPDAIVNRLIVNNEMLPRFRENDIYGGLMQACKVIMSLASKEFTAQEYEEQANANDLDREFVPVILLMLVLFVLYYVRFSMRSRNHTISTRKGGVSPPWYSSSNDSWGGFSSGGGSFGGGGSSFGGFGGGSFGGGGSGGSW